ncbi:helix-turn-helix transcriptional regulator [Glycomyces buryatensis]|uniref:helix-turn-helix transcriptional regulator n=1 Tax=Glycomyces buryatensis TaxID=2570927 RepID=UPI0014562888|nr:AAA family ATPase [Glycomyces buryatensis]
MKSIASPARKASKPVVQVGRDAAVSLSYPESPTHPPRPVLYGRDAELDSIQALLDGARVGHGGATVVRGEPGIGKSAIVDAVIERAEGFTVLRTLGVEAEHTWSYAGLQMLLHPLLDRIDNLPEVQAESLRTALGLGDGTAKPQRLQVGLAVLNLLVDASAKQPVYVVIDDAHWLDRDSTDALLFAARRLATESIAMVLVVRDGFAPDFPAPGIPELTLGPLDLQASQAILDTRTDAVPYSGRDWLLRLAEGNPLALLELPVADHEDPLQPPTTSNSRYSTTSRIKQAFTERLIALPDCTRTMLLVAAAEETGETAVIAEAAEKLGACLSDLEPAEIDDLVRYHQGRIEFVHPLIRSAAYHSSPRTRRIDAHRALSEAFGNGDIRHARHLAAATTGLDEKAAAALESIASYEAERGGCVAEMAAMERAASFTPDPCERARRLVEASQTAYAAGLVEKALELAESAERLTDNHVLLARTALIRATILSWAGDLGAFEVWMESAEHYAVNGNENTGYPLLRGVWNAWETGDFTKVEYANELATRFGGSNNTWAKRLARAAAGLNRRPWVSAGEAVDALRSLYDYYQPLHDDFHRFDHVLAARWRLLAGDVPAAHAAASEKVRDCREAGATSPLIQALLVQAEAQLHYGRYADAQAAATSAIELAAETDDRRALMQGRVWVLLPIAAIRGEERRCRELIAAAIEDAPEDSVIPADTSLGLLDLGLGHYEAAFDRLHRLVEGATPMEVLTQVPTLVEAAFRSGRAGEVKEAFGWFADWADATGRPYWEALVERCRGLLATDAQAGAHFARAVELHHADDIDPFERARTELVYGEWLRRERRINEARAHLREATEVFERLGAVPWTERAQGELRAAGDSTAIQTGPDLAERLTPQELQVVRLAADGLTNRQIGEQLFVSPRTVGYHLYNAYPKLGVSSRTELAKLDL